MANLKDLIVTGSARVLGTLYAQDMRNTDRITEFIVGTQTATTGSWTGVTKDDSLYDGKNINYFLPQTGSGNATLNLTLSNGTTTGAKPVYRWGTTYITTNYPVNSCISMTYNATKGAWFVDADYDVNDVTRLQWSNAIKASTAITANRVIVGDANGYKNIATNVTFDISYPILYSKSNINANATGANNWQSEPGINLANNKSGWTGTNYSVVYLVGTLSGTTFTIDSTMLTTTVPTTEDGKIYTPLGVMYSTTNCYFRPTNQYYVYKNGSFQPYISDGNGSSRNVGEIITSSLPLTDAGLHLLDGALIQGNGIYSDFVDYMAGLYGDGTDVPDYFCSEADWQDSITSYGVCGKFVYNSTNNTVRLPKITGIVEGTTDLTALGSLVEAGLPNITGKVGNTTWNVNGSQDFAGSLYWDKTSLGNFGASTQGAGSASVMLDASRSSSIYGNSSTVQPQTIKAFYYIVIANSTKTNVQVDIDEIATDLNGKADVDLSNCTKPHVIESYHNGGSWYRVWSDGWCEQGSTVSVTTDGIVTVSLLKPMVSYQVFKNYGATGTTSEFMMIDAEGSCFNKTSTSFETLNAVGDTTFFDWHAVGWTR